MIYSFVAASLASAALVSAQAAGGLTINTPTSLVTCQPAALSWTGGTGPYFVSVIPGGQPSAAALETFPDQTGNTFTWTAVDIAPNTSITIQIRDSTGTLAYTQAVTVQAGSSTSCVGQGSSSAAAGASGASSGTPAASSGSSAPAAGTNTASASGSRSASPAASSTTHSSGAPAASGSSTAQNSGAEKVGAGVFGVAVAAIFAIFA